MLLWLYECEDNCSAFADPRQLNNRHPNNKQPLLPFSFQVNQCKTPACEFMASLDEETHAFVLRLWREPRTLEGSKPIWRGVIEHVPTGQRRYVKDLNELVLFIISYLRKMGVALNWRCRLWAWWWSRRIDGPELFVSRKLPQNE